MAKVQNSQVSRGSPAGQITPEDWASQNKRGREDAANAITACQSARDSMPLTALMRDMVESGKLTGYEVGFLSAIAFRVVNSPRPN